MKCIGFFLSSRRRHTRYIGDWSSDVCSSDLGVSVDGGFGNAVPEAELRRAAPLAVADDPDVAARDRGEIVALGLEGRSEERRVGRMGGSGRDWNGVEWNEREWNGREAMREEK